MPSITDMLDNIQKETLIIGHPLREEDLAFRESYFYGLAVTCLNERKNSQAELERLKTYAHSLLLSKEILNNTIQEVTNPDKTKLRSFILSMTDLLPRILFILDLYVLFTIDRVLEEKEVTIISNYRALFKFTVEESQYLDNILEILLDIKYPQTPLDNYCIEEIESSYGSTISSYNLLEKFGPKIAIGIICLYRRKLIDLYTSEITRHIKNFKDAFSIEVELCESYIRYECCLPGSQPTKLEKFLFTKNPYQTSNILSGIDFKSNKINSDNLIDRIIKPLFKEEYEFFTNALRESYIDPVDWE